MIKNAKLLEKFESSLVRKEKINIKRNYMLLDGMYREAEKLGVFKRKNSMEGLDAAIKIARVLNMRDYGRAQRRK